MRRDQRGGSEAEEASLYFQESQSEVWKTSSYGCHMTAMETKKGKRKLRVRSGQWFPFPSRVPFLAIEDVKPKFNDISIFDEKEHRSGRYVRRELTA